MAAGKSHQRLVILKPPAPVLIPKHILQKSIARRLRTEGNEFHRGYAEARRCVSKYIDIGKLIISDEVSNKLNEMNRLLWKENFRFGDEGIDDSNYHNELSGHAENILKIIDGRLEEIIELSKRDLK